MASVLGNLLGNVIGSILPVIYPQSSYLADREHTEMREDTVYQRAVKDMQAAGLNPYTVGANASPSSSSSVGANTISQRLQMLGYILEIGNLSIKNRKVTNDLIGDVLKVLK